MIRLLKYELQSKWKMSLGVMVAYFVVYFGFLIKFNNDIKEAVGGMNMSSFDLDVMINTFGFKIIFFILLGSALFLASMIGAVNSLRLEAKQSSRDLYFSIPISAYTKIGSKLIVSLVEMTIAGLVAFTSVVKAFEYLSKLDIWKAIMDAIFSVPFEELSYLIISQFVYVAMMLIVVYLSFAIFRSFFTQIKFGGLITIVIYVALNYILIKVFGEFLANVEETTLTGLKLWGFLGLFTAFTAALFLLVGFLFEKRVSFD